MMSGDKTASVMTSWTTKVLNSRRRRRQFLEFRSSASAARRPTPAAPRNVTAVLVMLQKFTAILRNGRILLPRRIIFEPPSCIHLLTVCFSKHIEIRSFETEVCILVFVLPGMERGKGEVTPGHRESVENSGSSISGKQRSERKTCAKMCENLARWRKLRIETLVRKRFFLAFVALRCGSASTGDALATRLS